MFRFNFFQKVVSLKQRSVDRKQTGDTSNCRSPNHNEMLELSSDTGIEETNEGIEERLPVRNIVLNAQLSEQISIIHIELLGSEKLIITSYQDENVDLKTIIAIPIAMSDLLIKGIKEDEIVSRTREYSDNNMKQFSDWFTEKIKGHGNNFCIIINDYTDLNISWEFMPLPRTEKTGCIYGDMPIGAVVKMARWIPEIQHSAEALKLNIIDEIVEGKIIAYLDHEPDLNTDVEKEILKKFNTEPYQEFEDLKTELTNSTQNIGLFYVATHGYIEDDGFGKTTIKSSISENDPLSCHKLYNYRYIEHTSRPVVWINACNAACMFHHGENRHGWPKGFLKRVARAFMGTICGVGDKCASDMAASFLDVLYENPDGVCISELLTKLRYEAFRRLQENDSEENYSYFVFVCMYVLYGNPLIRLKLLRPI
ncbi:MAG: hypothetical protein GY749_50245 [Desulfobacteraceae bacterium]|nr:hypothetical protein [Desulfobacteraceae bacterium]